jgi:predicted AAA+ superfamily ATPase
LKALNTGLLPSVYFSDDPGEDLRSYVGTYLKEEITAEGLTRNIPAFARFLEVAAACSGTMFNKTEVANDAQVPRTTVIEYFEILKDTLIGYELPAWNRSRISELTTAVTRQMLARYEARHARKFTQPLSTFTHSLSNIDSKTAPGHSTA